MDIRRSRELRDESPETGFEQKGTEETETASLFPVRAPVPVVMTRHSRPVALNSGLSTLESGLSTGLNK